MNLLYYSSVLSHQELLTQFFEMSTVFSVPERQHFTWGIDGNLWTRRSGCWEAELPSKGSNEKSSVWKFILRHWLTLLSRCAKPGREKSLQLDNLGCQLFQNTLVFSGVCLGLACRTPRCDRQDKIQQHSIFFQVNSNKKNQPCPEDLEVKAFGSKWPKGIRMRCFRLLKVS